MGNRKLVWMVSVFLGGAAIFVWSTRGYGEVSSDAYEVSKALYGACLAKSEARLDSVEELFDDDAVQSLEISDRERRWLESMIETAKNGNWESAAKSARRMMEDQVKY